MDFSITILDIVILLAILLGLIYLYGTWTFGRFSKHGVPHLTPVPLLGDFWRATLRMENPVDGIARVYKSFPEHRYVGLFQMRLPSLMIRDPELIKMIGVKDFDHFVDRRGFINEDFDPLFGNNLTTLKDQKWRDMRATLSPAFTGSKMRAMYSLVSEVAQQMAEYLVKETQDKGRTDLEMKNLFTRYTNDVIATTAFGIKVDSFENSENEFYKMGKRLTNFTGLRTTLKFLGFNIAPTLMKALGITLFDPECTFFFRDLVHDTMKIREEQGIVRPDMIHLLMQARQGTLQHDNTNTTLTQQQDAGFATVTESDIGKTSKKRVWTDNELIAQALVFLLAGFETTATVLSFTAHELAVNPGVQERLQEEIDEFGKDKVPDYETINRLKYLDMVVSEVLRMWSPAPIVDRNCIKPYVLESHEGKKYQIEVGDNIVFPVHYIHHDPKYYENPDKFDPERFSDENRKNIQPFTYLPFGVGPRNCIGSRFALMEVKAILFHLLSKFSFEPCVKTEIPMKLTRKSFVIAPENGFWLTVKPRISK